ncbi:MULTISPECIES: alpha/beta fold hydrolase [unclassified Pseudomonas]|jgi:proline iminopeptidase|uniref:alpha/beta fold hydrolase n=1 Tax=unclassified Pseudomonas TaxID=196821 RepID=UPI000C86D81C|nr:MULTISPECIES: alpha/beta fold hydrolase [unclassified Pseudomonas]PMV25011.1 alpha/beta hydrolase [Pseudomonas sp. FW305-3-2-15-C-TSA2]PMV28716.1 alpha/beta hydrolase [Pseudomonas sp. DP16D-L5]PMV33250.1 alpha/beta hydrolase [Pseudomonas sp. FW305-3-2-15-A-LB2]PMV48919.1 alpha/beta hydrolase [Pseudomonas sp. FW305-3-2-15-C-R2A1]PMV53465.1 alpha/beta hydrolase [Pseudomonas sp. FW305-3-2-15-C-LB1]
MTHLQSSGYLPVSDNHQLYWERHGREGAEPVFFLHGGPGGCSSRDHLAFFNLEHFDIVLFDQRGGGRSTPHGERLGNETERIIDDIETLREHFGFAQITVLGVSWGSWLALKYAWQRPSHVHRLVLASLFVPSPENLVIYHHAVTRYLSAKAFTSFEQVCEDLDQPCRQLQRQAALAWVGAALHLNRQRMDKAALEHFIDDVAVRAIRLEVHYHRAGYFFHEQDQGLMLRCSCQVIQGIHDPVGLSSLRWLRQRALLKCRLFRAGHDAFDPVLVSGIEQSLMATNRGQ